ncbi:MAG TPA: hypothetical protein VLH75_00535 [Longimicrobiales bacterium]|nr:hypothetical protein [Longimicrobiales bacterium]
MGRVWAGLVAAALVAAPVQGQVRWERGGEGWCDQERGGRDQEHACETLTARMRSTGSLQVDADPNGGIQVTSWSGADVEVVAKVSANASTEARAQELAAAVRIAWEGSLLSADGPRPGRREGWSVSYEIKVPANTDLDLQTLNGGIDVEGVSGDIRFEAVNGGIHLARVGGDVRGTTRNGGLDIELDGARWSGTGLDAETTNGGVTVSVPQGYSAELEMGTVNGGFDIGFPVTVKGRIGHTLRTTLGDGGPAIRAVTTNGGVRIVQGG